MNSIAKSIIALATLAGTASVALDASAVACAFAFPGVNKTCISGGDQGRGSLRNPNVGGSEPGVRHFFIAFDSGQFDAQLDALDANGGLLGCHRVDSSVANGGNSGTCQTAIFPTTFRVTVN